MELLVDLVKNLQQTLLSWLKNPTSENYDIFDPTEHLKFQLDFNFQWNLINGNEARFDCKLLWILNMI